MEKYKQEMEKRQRPNPGDKLKMERQGPDSTTQESLRYQAETEHDNQRKNKTCRTVTTDRLQAGKNGASVLHTNPGRGRHH